MGLKKTLKKIRTKVQGGAVGRVIANSAVALGTGAGFVIGGSAGAALGGAAGTGFGSAFVKPSKRGKFVKRGLTVAGGAAAGSALLGTLSGAGTFASGSSIISKIAGVGSAQAGAVHPPMADAGSILPTSPGLFSGPSELKRLGGFLSRSAEKVAALKSGDQQGVTANGSQGGGFFGGGGGTFGAAGKSDEEAAQDKTKMILLIGGGAAAVYLLSKYA